MQGSEVFTAIPWINIHAKDEAEGAQRLATLEAFVNQRFPWVDYGDPETYRDTDGNQEPWTPSDTVEAATDRFAPYLGKTWLRQVRAYGPAPRPFFLVRSYEPNPEALDAVKS